MERSASGVDTLLTSARVDHPRAAEFYARAVFRRQADITIIERDAWADGRAPTGPIEAEDDVRFLIVHHTVSSNTYGEGDVVGILRSMYNFHTNDKGWSDVAYNFCVDRFGRVWEARAGSAAGAVRGDATGGSQGFAILCAFIGDHRTEAPSEAATQAMGGLLAALGGRYGIDLSAGATTTFTSRGSNRHPAGTAVTAPTVCPHRMMSQTECPGDAGVAHIEERLVPIASGTTPSVSTTTTIGTTTASTTTASTTTASPTTAATSASTEATSTTTTSEVPTTADASTTPSSPMSGAVDDDALAFPEARSDGDGADVVLVGSAGLVVAGVAALIGLRRRSSSREG